MSWLSNLSTNGIVIDDDQQSTEAGGIADKV